MKVESFLSLLQFSDGLFPAGSYAHSYGLESCVADGTVKNAGDVTSFLRALLQGSVAPTDGLAALCSSKACRAGDMETCLMIDASLDAMKSASELRAASRQMGRQVLRIAYNLTAPGLTSDLFRAVENGESPGHHALAFGAVGAAMDWRGQELVSAYLYSTCSGLVAAALRLLPLGQLAGQRILWELLPLIARLADQSQDTDFADIWSFAPALEIAAMRHETLESRLFRS